LSITLYQSWWNETNPQMGCWLLYYITSVIDAWVSGIGRIIMTGENLNTQRKPRSSATMSNVHPTCSALGLNTGLRYETPKTKH
jgi:hypothetical protein